MEGILEGEKTTPTYSLGRNEGETSSNYNKILIHSSLWVENAYNKCWDHNDYFFDSYHIYWNLCQKFILGGVYLKPTLKKIQYVIYGGILQLCIQKIFFRKKLRSKFWSRIIERKRWLMIHMWNADMSIGRSVVCERLISIGSISNFTWAFKLWFMATLLLWAVKFFSTTIEQS